MPSLWIRHGCQATSLSFIFQQAGIALQDILGLIFGHDYGTWTK